jgi:hypothetical protein
MPTRLSGLKPYEFSRKNRTAALGGQRDQSSGK